MAGSARGDYGTDRSSDGFFNFTSGQNSQSGEALAVCRLSDQVDNGTPSSSPPYWDTDEDDNGGPKPSMLYGRHTWKIEKLSQTTKRELTSKVFDVGGYEWYILIYPQGCDVCNHLSLFLCVANHDKLRPGWSHFAQFTIAAVNKDPKKSKYSDTLHRFWKKEHDWGWKKFMELSKVQDGFIVDDTLEIRAQVQIIREKANQPFCCLDSQYRRELVRVYIQQLEFFCHKLVEDRRNELCELIDDKVRWISFCTFWIGIDQRTKYTMSREKTDVIMRVAVKQLFVEKEVTSTLVMDSLNSGLKSLKAASNSKQESSNLLGSWETSAPYISVEDDMFALTDDMLVLLGRLSLEHPRKNVSACQNNVKEGNSGDDFIMVPSEQYERRLTYLGRMTIETFVLAHIFSKKIEAAHQEEVAFKRQEELIREEEEAGLAVELKEKRRVAMREKRSKRKMMKQNCSYRKGKDRGKDKKFNGAEEGKLQSSLIKERIEETNSLELAQSIPEKDIEFDTVSDVTDIDDDLCEPVQLDIEGQHTSCVYWNGDTSEVPSSIELRSSSPLGNENTVRSPLSIDDSSSTCSTDSIPSVVINGPCKKNSFVNYETQNSANRERNERPLVAHKQMHRSNNTVCNATMIAKNGDATIKRTKSDEPVLKVVSSSKGRIQKLEPQLTKKGATVSSQQIAKEQVFRDRPSKQIPAETPSSTRDPNRNSISNAQSKTLSNGKFGSVSAKEDSAAKRSQNGLGVTAKMHPPQTVAILRPVVKKNVSTRPFGLPVENPTNKVQHVRPTSCSNAFDTTVVSAVPMASIVQTNPIPFKIEDAPIILTAETAPSLSRSSNTTERLETDFSPAILSSGSGPHQSYIGTGSAINLSGYMPSVFHPSSCVASPPVYSPTPALALSHQNSTGTNHTFATSGFTFGSVTPEVLNNQPLWIETSQGSSSTTSMSAPVSMVNGPHSVDSLQLIDGFGTSALSHQVQSSSMSEFPHLDIIDFLFDDELGDNMRVNGRTVSEGTSGNFLRHQFVFPNDMSTLVEMGSMANGPFEQPMVYYDDVTQAVYGAFTNYTNGLSNVGLPVDFSMYGGWQFHGMVQNPLPIGYSSNVCLVGDGYPIHAQEYRNLACGVGAYGSFQPSSGH